MKVVPDNVILARRLRCEQAGCELLPKLNLSDPCALCPDGHWGMYFCSEPWNASREWPTILKPMKLLARPTDKGLGDIVERVVGPIGGDAYKAWYKTIFGKPCGCTHRQDRLNQLFPLP